MGATKRPEFVSLLTLLTMLRVLAAAAAGTGGSDSPVLGWLAIPPARLHCASAGPCNWPWRAWPRR